MLAERSGLDSKVIAVLLAACLWAFGSLSAPVYAADVRASGASLDDAKPDSGKGETAGAGPSVELSKSMLSLIKIGAVGTRTFAIDRSIVGMLDYNQDKQLQIFTPYQGRIIELFAQLGDRVKKDQSLYTVDSADLLQAEATLLQTAGVDALTRATLLRTRRLLPAGGGAQKDLDQAISDQQTAEGNLKVARQALHIFGKSAPDIDQIVSDHKIDSTLVVKSPINGTIVARNASAGLFIQPGTAPAPYSIADTSSLWLNGSAGASDIREFKVGQDVEASIMGIPDQVFRGTVSALGPTIDSATRRLTVRAVIDNADDVLRPGMFATVTIRTSKPREAIALPVNGVVREGDGTLTAWVTTDQRHFTQRTIRIGLQQNGYDEIVTGLRLGELVVTDGAVFVSNVLNAPPSD